MGCLCFGRKSKNLAERDEKDSLRSNHRPDDSQAQQQNRTKQSPGPSQTKVRQPVREDGLTQLAPPQTSADAEIQRTFALDIVAIHGLGGHPRETWVDKESQVAWLEDLLPRDLPNARIFTYGYNAKVKWSESVGDIDDWARTLLQCLSLERNESHQQSLRPLVFICHSMGGLVCKKALILAHEQERFKDILESTKAICFFATPHRGSSIADFASFALGPTKVPFKLLDLVFGVGVFRKDLIKILGTDERFLDQLNASFKERGTTIDKIISFSESKTIHNVLVVKKGSGSLGLDHEQDIPIEATHTEICRLTDRGSLAYKTVKQLCEGIINSKYSHQRRLSSDEEKWLKSLEPEDIQENGSERAGNTCEWIIEEFDAWRNRGVPILWISGELGYGKTTSLFYLKDRLRSLQAEDQKNQANLTVCSFFCDSRSEALKDMRLLLRKIMWEMLSKRHDLIRHVGPYYDETSQWSLENLWRVFQSIMADPEASDTVILVDGLDECREPVRNNFFSRLASCFKEIQASSRKTINFVFSSRSVVIRQTPEMNDLSKYLRLDEDRSLRKIIHTEIENYVATNLSRLIQSGDSREELTATWANSIATQAEGSFLWAALVMERAQEEYYGNNENLERILAECPPKLEGMYYQALQKMQSHQTSHQTKIRKSFGILLAAKRPLTVDEFYSALFVEAHHQTLDDLEAAQQKDFGFLSYLRDHLGIFIKADAPTITYRHESVKDFVFHKLRAIEDQAPTKYNSRITMWLDLSEKKAERVLAEACISFLKLDTFNEPRDSSEMNEEALEDSGLMGVMLDSEPNSPKPPTLSIPARDPGQSMFKVPFFEYAASQWGYHYAHSEPLDPDPLAEVDLMLLVRDNLAKSWSSLFRKRYTGNDPLPEEFDALLVAAYFGHEEYLMKIYSQSELAWDEERALAWACRMGHSKIVEFLVEHGVSHSHYQLDEKCAFSWAVNGGFLDIVTSLLSKDPAAVNVRTSNGSSPLLLAVSQGHLHVVARLLNTKNIDVNLSNKYGLRPIHMVVNGPFTSIDERKALQLLLKRRELDITPRDNWGRTILWYAADVGATQTIKMLLDCRREQDVERLFHDCGDNCGESPLFRASYNGDVGVIKMLCESELIQHQYESIDDMDGGNVFEVAAKRGQAAAIEALGKYYRAGVNSQNHTGRTPLSVAMWEGNLSVLRALCKLEAKVDLADDNGRTPISFGCQQIEGVRYLVQEKGANINIKDNEGHSPLWYAKKFQDDKSQLFAGTDIVKELIALGAEE